MGTTGGGPAAGPGGLGPFMLPILIFAIFYFLIILPQKRKAREHREMIENLKKGDRVMTSSGIIGSIAGLDEETISLEISEKVRVKMGRGFVSQVMSGSRKTPAKSEKLKSKS